MKKLYGKGKVHPSPPPPNYDYLSLLAALPAAILALTAALTAEDQEVLAYLISCGGRRNNSEEKKRGGGEHREPVFGCSCFHCYTRFWAKWDASPNRQLIHEIIDALELEEESLRLESTTRRRSRRRSRGSRDVNKGGRDGGGWVEEEQIKVAAKGLNGGVREDDEESAYGEGDEDEGNNNGGKSSFVRGILSLLGERIWGGWGQ